MRFPSPPRSFALYKPACSTAFACFKIDESYFKAKLKSDLDSSTKYLDYSKAYDGLVDYANLAHCRVKHLKNKF